MATLPLNKIALGMIPSQRRQGMINPKENSPTDWQFQPQREPGFSKAFFPADEQSDNYYTLNEGHKQILNGMFDNNTTGNPIFGHVNFQLNPLDNNKTNLQANDNQKQTRVSWSNSAFRSMRMTPSQMPNYGGKPDYANFDASPYFLTR